MSINEVFELANGDALFLTFEEGTHKVYDMFEIELAAKYDTDYPNALFSGHYEDAISFIRDVADEAEESILF